MSDRGERANGVQKISTWKAIFGGDAHGDLRKVRYYIFITSITVAILAAMALLNAYLRFVDVPSYEVNHGLSSSFLIAGYLGMFLTILLSPVPDYFMVPAFGSLAAVGVFDPYLTFVVCLAGAIVPVGYVPGRFVGRPLLLKGVAYFGISEKAIDAAEGWIEEHGRFSIFLSTFVPFFYTVASLAAGMLKMNAVKFMLASAVGYGVRFAVLEYIGYNSIYVFTASFDYSQRYLIAVVLIAASVVAFLSFVKARGPGAAAGP